MHPDQFCGTTVCYPRSMGPSFTFDRALRGISGVGLRKVEVVSIDDYCLHVPLEIADDVSAAEAVRAQMEVCALEPVVLNLNANLTTRQGVDRLLLACRAAQRLGISIVVTGVEETADVAAADAFFRFVDCIVEGLEGTGVRLGLETHGGLATTGEQAVRLVKQIGCRQIGITYDTANVVYWGGIAPETDLERILDDLPELLLHVHLKDKASWARGEYDFPVFGQGVLNLPRVLELLAAINYKGPLSVEVELDGHPSSPEQVDEALETSLAFLHRVLDSSSPETARRGGL